MLSLDLTDATAAARDTLQGIVFELELAGAHAERRGGRVMIALTRDDLLVLQLALECLISDTARKQKAAIKRRDAGAVSRLRDLGDACSRVKRKVIQMSG